MATKLNKKRSELKKQIQTEREKMLSKYKTRYDNVKGMIPTKKSVQFIPREIPVVASLNSDVGNTEAKQRKEYTGTKLVGIATMHKSNMVPVFSKDEAEQISKMRRN